MLYFENFIEVFTFKFIGFFSGAAILFYHIIYYRISWETFICLVNGIILEEVVQLLVKRPNVSYQPNPQPETDVTFNYEQKTSAGE